MKGQDDFQVFNIKCLRFQGLRIQTSKYGFSKIFTTESLAGNMLLLMAKRNSCDM